MSNLLQTAGLHEWRVRSQRGVITEALRLSDRTDLTNEIIARRIIELTKAGSAIRTGCAIARCGVFGSSEDQATTIRSRRCREAIDALRFERKSGPYGRPAMNIVHAAAAMLALLSLCTIGRPPPKSTGPGASATSRRSRSAAPSSRSSNAWRRRAAAAAPACRIPGSCSMANAGRRPMPSRAAGEASGASFRRKAD